MFKPITRHIGYLQIAADQLTGRFGYVGPLFDPDPPAPSPAPAGDPAASFQRLLQKKEGDATALASQLYDENYRYRERIRELEKSAPAQGSVVLTAEQAAQWSTYQELGKAEDLKTVVSERDTLRTERDTLKRTQTLADVAAAAGYKPSVLERLGADLTYELRDVTVDGKTVKQAFVKDGDMVKPLSEYAAAQWSDFLPALQQTTQPTPDGQGQGQQQPPRTQGAPFIQQNAGGPPPAGGDLQSLANSFQEQRDKAYNPLAPQ